MVLIDTAGRMQDNEVRDIDFTINRHGAHFILFQPLMRALAKVVAPHLQYLTLENY